jgi:hypothetical protein
MLTRDYKYSLFTRDLRSSQNAHVSKTLDDLNYVIGYDPNFKKKQSGTISGDLHRTIDLNGRKILMAEVNVSVEEGDLLTPSQISLYRQEKVLRLLADNVYSEEIAKSIYDLYEQSVTSLLRICLTDNMRAVGFFPTQIVRSEDGVDLPHRGNIFYCEKYKKIFYQVYDSGFKLYHPETSVSCYVIAQSTLLYEIKTDGFHLINISTDSLLIRDMVMGVHCEDVNFYDQDKYAATVILGTQKEKLPAAIKTMRTQHDVLKTSTAYLDRIALAIDIAADYTHPPSITTWVTKTAESIFASTVSLFTHHSISKAPYLEASRVELTQELERRKKEINRERISIWLKYADMSNGLFAKYLLQRNTTYQVKDYFEISDKDHRTYYLQQLTQQLDVYLQLDISSGPSDYQHYFVDLQNFILGGIMIFKPRKKYLLWGTESTVSLKVLLEQLQVDMIILESKLKITSIRMQDINEQIKGITESSRLCI